MNFSEPATSQWCHIYGWYSVATFTWTVHCGTHWCCLRSVEYFGIRSLQVQRPGSPAPPDVWHRPSGRT
jgi:hypothetical protein